MNNVSVYPNKKLCNDQTKLAFMTVLLPSELLMSTIDSRQQVDHFASPASTASPASLVGAASPPRSGSSSVASFRQRDEGRSFP